MTTEDRKAARDSKLLALVTEHAGLDAMGLKRVGWRPQTHGSLLDAERRGLIRYRDGWQLNLPDCKDEE